MTSFLDMLDFNQVSDGFRDDAHIDLSYDLQSVTDADFENICNGKYSFEIVGFSGNSEELSSLKNSDVTVYIHI